jgi:hypothetical protein
MEHLRNEGTIGFMCLNYGTPYSQLKYGQGVSIMYGIFGGYTRWAVVFLIIFVLFFLLVPAYGAPTAAAAPVC